MIILFPCREHKKQIRAQHTIHRLKISVSDPHSFNLNPGIQAQIECGSSGYGSGSETLLKIRYLQIITRVQKSMAVILPPCELSSVAKPKLFVSAPIFKKFPAPIAALWVPVFTAYKWKSRFFMIFTKEYWLDSLFFILFSSMNYDLIHYFSLTRSREPEPKLQYNSSGSLRLRLHKTGA